MPTNRTAVTLIHGFLIAANVAAGAINIHFHRHGYWFSFAAAGFILALNVAFQMRYRRIRQLEEQVQARDGHIPMNARIKAKKNLLQAIKVTPHATWDDPLEMIIYRVPKNHTRFLIRPGSIVREKPGQIEGTCFFCAEEPNGKTTPYQEQMATALLLLRNNPKLFDKWKRHDGAYHA